MQFLSRVNSLVGWNAKSGLYWGLLSETFSLGGNIGFAADGNRHIFRASFSRREYPGSFKPFVSELTFNGQTVQRDGTPTSLPGQWLYGIFAPYSEPAGYAGSIRMWACKCWSAAAKFDLIPALRNSDGVPGMFDRVRKQFFENAGTGVFGYRVKGAPATYSLRDPHRVAPSGVWARLAADGMLDAVAETELDEEQATALGYAYFANTADAAEVLGVTEQELV